MAGRNLLRENERVAKTQGISIYILGWTCQIGSIVAGSFAADSWPGATIRWILGLVPGGFIIPLALVVGFVVWFIDIINDLTPNQAAVTYGFVGPILAASPDNTGKLASSIASWANTLQAAVAPTITSWVGNLSAGWLAVGLMACCGIVAKRALSKTATAAGRSGGGGAGGRLG